MEKFDLISPDKINDLINNKDSQNTKSQNKSNENKLKSFISYLNINKNLVELNKIELNDILKQFWPSLRNKGTELKISSMHAIRYCL